MAKLVVHFECMSKENFDRIIDYLQVKYVLASKRVVIKPVELSNTIEQKDVFLQVNAGHFTAGLKQTPIPEGHFYFVPRGSTIHFRHGQGPYEVIGTEGFTSPEQREKYLKPIDPRMALRPGSDVFTILGFEVLIHGAIPFFQILELPPVMMGENQVMSELLHKIMIEEYVDPVGKSTMVRKYTDEMIIHICRHIYDNPALFNKVQKLDYLLDRRLINIIQFIQDNLGDDLSNHKIASLAFVSKDYIGQFFKSMTGSNLQDYIENRRLDQAHFLLRSTTDSIQDIAAIVGFKDPAYFSRRFKFKFNQNAKEVRKSDHQVF